MGTLTRSAFAAALCAGLAMVGASVHGLIDVDAELQRSVVAVQEQQHHARAVSFRVSWREGECPAPPPRTRTRA
jgi:hypothetical protein